MSRTLRENRFFRASKQWSPLIKVEKECENLFSQNMNLWNFSLFICCGKFMSDLSIALGEVVESWWKFERPSLPAHCLCWPCAFWFLFIYRFNPFRFETWFDNCTFIDHNFNVETSKHHLTKGCCCSQEKCITLIVYCQINTDRIVRGKVEIFFMTRTQQQAFGCNGRVVFNYLHNITENSLSSWMSYEHIQTILTHIRTFLSLWNQKPWFRDSRLCWNSTKKPFAML